MSEAPEAAVEETPAQPISEEAFGDLAAARMREVFGPRNEEGELVDEQPVDDSASLEARPPVADTLGPDGIWYDDQGRAHSADGKFVSSPEPGEPDPSTHAVEEKYGTPEEAWKAAQHAQQLLNQQREEIGQTRAEMAALRAEMEALGQNVNQRMSMPRDELIEMIDENPKQAAHQAARQGDPEVMEQALRAWAEESPGEAYEAARFRNAIENQYREYQRQEAENAARAQAQAPYSEPDEGITADDTPAIAAVIAKHPDINAFIGPIGAKMEQYPVMADALRYGQPEQKAQALEALYALAKADHGAIVGNAQTNAAAAQAQAASDARAAAAVVSASQTSSAPGGQPTFADRVRQDFRESAIASGKMRPPD